MEAMADTARKLLIKPGDRVLVVDAPDDPTTMLGPLPDGAAFLQDASTPPSVAVVFTSDLPAFTAATPLLRRWARSARAVWVAYPKLTSAKAGSLSRDTIRTTLDATDITTVTQVAIDETWSAIRLRTVEDVGR
jgi:hypothetical protein